MLIIIIHLFQDEKDSDDENIPDLEEGGKPSENSEKWVFSPHNLNYHL